MKLQTIHLRNFLSFREAPTDIDLDDVTYLIGPNRSGKTAALIALCRVFSIDPALRRVQRSSSEIRMGRVGILCKAAISCPVPPGYKHVF